MAFEPGIFFATIPSRNLNPDGTVKVNDLNCVQCHTPLQQQDYLFSFQKLVDFATGH